MKLSFVMVFCLVACGDGEIVGLHDASAGGDAEVDARPFVVEGGRTWSGDDEADAAPEPHTCPPWCPVGNKPPHGVQ